MTHTYLFFKDSGLLYRYKVRLSEKGKSLFEILPYSNDEEYREYSNDDFFEEWANDARFVKDYDRVDFSFLSDDEAFHPKIPHDYSVNNSENFFSFAKIKSFAEKKLDYKAFTLVYQGRKEGIRTEAGHASGKEKTFFAVIPFPSEADNGPEACPSEVEDKSAALPPTPPVKVKSDSFRHIELAAAHVKRTGDFLKRISLDLQKNRGSWNKIRDKAEQIWKARGCPRGQDDEIWREAEKAVLTTGVWFNKDILEDLQELIGKMDRIYDNLKRPCLKIAFVGTTSSGKSTLLNGLAGCRIAPMEAGEMSAGVVRIRNDHKVSLVVCETENMAWPSGDYPVKNDDDVYNALRDKEKGIMNLYWQAAKKNENVKAPEIDIAARLAPKNGGIPGFIMPEGIGLEFYDLPGLNAVTDSRNLDVIQRHLAGSFLLIVLNYSDTDTEKRKTLLLEIKKIVDSICRNKEALLFVLNRVDERNSEDDPLETRVESLRKDIKERLEMPALPVVIPMSALPLYLLQTAWGTETTPLHTQGLAGKAKTQLQKFFDDCSKIIKSISKENPEKRAWFKANDEDNIDEWISRDMKTLLDWVYDYSGAYKFWDAMQKKLDEQIGAIIINPALEGTPVLLEDFAKKLDGVIDVLGLSTKEEIQREKDKIESLSKEVKKNIAVFKEGFIKDFRESIDACKSGELQRLKEHPQFMKMREITREIMDDVHDTIMIPIRDALVENDVNKLDELEHKLSHVIPSHLASDIKRMATQLLLRGYGEYAREGKLFQCRLDKKETEGNSAKIQKYEEITQRRMNLAGYVDKALLSRSQLLLQQKLLYFQDVTQDIIKNSMERLAKRFADQIRGVDAKSMVVPIPVMGKNIDLPGNVFSKISIEKASEVMKKTVKESY